MKFKLPLTYCNTSFLETQHPLQQKMSLSRSFNFSCCFLHIICYNVADRNLWSFYCKVICSLSFPVNSRFSYKTFCFGEINAKIDFEMKVESSPQFITSENENNLN